MLSNYSIQRIFKATNFRISKMKHVLVWLQGICKYIENSEEY